MNLEDALQVVVKSLDENSSDDEFQEYLIALEDIMYASDQFGLKVDINVIQEVARASIDSELPDPIPSTAFDVLLTFIKHQTGDAVRVLLNLPKEEMSEEWDVTFSRAIKAGVSIDELRNHLTNSSHPHSVIALEALNSVQKS